MTEPTLDQVTNDAISTFTSANLFTLETGRQPNILSTFADLAFKAYKALQQTILQKNPFIKQDTLFGFGRSLIAACHFISTITVNDILKDKITEDLTSAKTAAPPKPHEASDEELAQWIKQLHHATSEEHTRIRRRTQSAATALYVEYFNRFNQLYSACDSPLEQAFLVGILAHSEHTWLDLLEPNNNTFKAQHPVGPYKLDFAFLNEKIAIELDGHTYHERTEKQAVHDRSRDRELQQQGWKIFRFHRQEIETNMEQCIKEILASR